MNSLQNDPFVMSSENQLQQTSTLETFKKPRRWVQGCMIYSLAFWDSDVGEIKRDRLDNSKILRYFAESAITMREKRHGLRKISRVLTPQNVAERVAVYLAITEQASDYHVDELFRTTDYKHPIMITSTVLCVSKRGILKPHTFNFGFCTKPKTDVI